MFTTPLTLRNTFLPSITSKWARRPVLFLYDYEGLGISLFKIFYSVLRLRCLTPYDVRIRERALAILNEMLNDHDNDLISPRCTQRGTGQQLFKSSYTFDIRIYQERGFLLTTDFVKHLCDYGVPNFYPLVRRCGNIHSLDTLYEWIDTTDRSVVTTQIPLVPFSDSMTELMMLLKTIDKRFRYNNTIIDIGDTPNASSRNV